MSSSIEHTAIYDRQKIKELLVDLPKWTEGMKGAIKDDITPPYTETFLYARQMKYVCGNRIIEVKLLKGDRIQVQY